MTPAAQMILEPSPPRYFFAQIRRRTSAIRLMERPLASASALVKTWQMTLRRALTYSSWLSASARQPGTFRSQEAVVGEPSAPPPWESLPSASPVVPLASSVALSARGFWLYPVAVRWALQRATLATKQEQRSSPRRPP